MFDKTFLLILTLSIAWASHHVDDHEHENEAHDTVTNELTALVKDKEHHGEHAHGHIIGYKYAPFRMVVSTTIGTIVINIKSIWF